MLGFLGALLLLFDGCTTYHTLKWGRPPPDLDKVEAGTPRQTVQSLLGKPVRREYNVHTYEYNTRDGPNPVLGAFFDFFTMGSSAFYWDDFERVYKAQRRRLSVVYGPNDKVIGRSYERAEAGFRDWLHSEDRAKEFKSLCLSANEGYAPAQATLAMHHRYGLPGTAADPVQAHLWLILAAFGGHPSAAGTLEAWTATMSPERVAEAERLVAEWVPDPSACEVEGATLIGNGPDVMTWSP
jgi:hypothetical protein